MTTQSIGDFLPAVERLYAAALGAADWQDFLALIAPLFGADNAYVSQIEHDRRTLNYVVLRPVDWDTVSVGRYTELMDDDPRMPAFRGNPGRALDCRMVVSQRQLHASRIYQEALKPLDIEYTMVVGLPEDNGDVTNYLGLTRGASGVPFEPPDRTLFDELIPHLSRAFTIRKTLSDSSRQNDVLKHVVERLPQATFVADRVGTVLHMNTAARELSEAGRGMRITGGRLRLDSGLDQDRLLNAITATTAEPATCPKIVVLSPFGQEAFLTLTVEPSTAAMADPLAKDDDKRLAIISVQSSSTRADTDESRLRRMFGLSPAQVRLTSLLGAGLSVKEAVRILGITEGSARQYLKIIFNKTGAKRQADLVRVISKALLS